MKREDCLNDALTQVTGQRTQDYGTPENNFQTIADFWNIYLMALAKSQGHCPYNIPDVTATDVALMMDLLKTARLITTPTHADSWIDKAGYSACGAEVSGA